MGLWFCPNCRNLKTRELRRKDLGGLSKYMVTKAIKENRPDSLGLSFPINLAAFKRLTKRGVCKIVYCSEGLLPRRLYIYHDNLEGSLTPDKNIKCPKYK